MMMKKGKKKNIDDEASFLFADGPKNKHKVFNDEGEEYEENDADLSSDIKSMLKSFASEYGAELIHDKEIGEEIQNEKREQRKENKKRFADLAKSKRNQKDSNRTNSSKTEAALYDKFQAWYNAVALKSEEADKNKITLPEIEKLKEKATNLYESLKSQFEQIRETSQTVDDKWLGTVMKSGTTSDKLAAITLSIQENPFFRLDKFNHIIQLIRKKPSLAIMALNTSVDLWTNNILPDRKLLYFTDRPLYDKKLLTDNNLVDWIFEDQLKEIYLNYVQELQKCSQSTLEALRSKSTKHIFTLLSTKPEQEKLLLAALVNKLGDPSKQVGSSAGYFLDKLIRIHPNMRAYVIKEVELIIFRPSVGFHALQYGLGFLSQIMLSAEDTTIANRLIDLYFNVFKTLTSKREVHSKILDILLTGIHRAFPFSEFDESSYSTHIDDLFKLVHISSISKAIQALQVLYHIISSRYVLADRYYRALYQLLLSPDLRLCSKQMLFLNLLYKSIKIDSSIERISAFLKRLLQVCLYADPGFATGAIYLLSKIVEARPETKVLIEDYAQQQQQNKEGGGEVKPEDTLYDPVKREPLYSNASKSCCWELVLLSNHYHPSVRVCVEKLMNGEKIPMESDPLQDHSISNFLDKFSLKNPKVSNTKHTVSPLASKSVKPSLINAADLLKKKQEEIPEDQMFFYKFFQGKIKEKQREKEIKEAGKERISSQLEKYYKTEYDYEDLADDDFYDDDAEMYYEQDQDIIEDQLEWDEENMAATSSLGGIGDEEDEEQEEEEGTQSSVFAAAEEFQDLLDETETPGQVKQRGWEDRSSSGGKRKGNNFKRKLKKFKQ